MQLDRFSEPYQATGNIASVGMLNQLGRPNLDILEILVRESVQNSWDARLNDYGGIIYEISGWKLSSFQHRFLKELLKNRPPNLALNKYIESNDVNVLAISDRNTTGLEGPTRADFIARDDKNNFVNFLRNIGQPPSNTKTFSGGTYGYGKASYYLASLARTIIVYTKCSHSNRDEVRLMVSGLGDQYFEGNKFTGRHWWGNYRNKVIEPLLDDNAESVANRLGLRPFDEQEYGTTILVICPNFMEMQGETALRLISEYLLWYFWPKMLILNDTIPIRFQVKWNGSHITIPNPEAFPPLEGFVQALTNLKLMQQHPFGQILPIQCGRPKQHLGFLSLQRFPRQARTTLTNDVDHKSELNQLKRKSHHVALLRQAELVVKYMSGPEIPNNNIEYAGVFITDQNVDKAFANAEPPTHDNWIATTLPKPDKTFVNVALRRISETIREFAKPASNQISDEQIVPLGAFANLLGGLLPGQDGPAAVSNPFKNQRTSTISRPNTTSNITQNNATHDVSQSTEQDLSKASSLQEIFGSDDTSRSTDVPNQFENDQGAFRQGNSDNELAHSVSNEKSSNISGDQKNNGLNIEPVTNTSDISTTFVSNSSLEPQRKILGRAHIEILEDLLEEYEDKPVLRVTFKVRHADGSEGTNVKARISVLLDGLSPESEPPTLAKNPEILFWIEPTNIVHSGYDAMEIPKTVIGICQIVISVPDVMVEVDLQATPVMKMRKNYDQNT